MKIFVYGPPGSGKTSIGLRLADHLHLPFFDLDQQITKHTGQSIPRIFQAEGEAGFRRRERQALTGLLDGGEKVVSLGGGALLDPQNRAQVEAAGKLICLKASFESLAARLEDSHIERPLLHAQASEAERRSKLQDLLEKRQDHYASFPLRIETDDRPLEDVVWEALIQLGAFRASSMPPGYDVRIREGSLLDLGQALQQRGLNGPVALVSDENVAPLYAQDAQDTLARAGFNAHPVVIPAGEQFKTVETITNLWQAFLSAGVERGSTIVALGGGVVGDLAGFAAATFLRGVPWVVLPTTLLSMADASLGGKTGADLPQGKNLVGAFHPPRLVLADPHILSSLPLEELRSGMAEVIKAGVIGDSQLFELCSLGWDGFEAHRQEIVSRAMAVKVRVIEADPYEKGLRAVLNFGHTIGHGVELASGFRLRHGEAVAIGMMVETRLAEKLGLAEPGLSGMIKEILNRFNLPTEIPPEMDRGEILQAMRVDKKRARGKVRFALPVRIGEVTSGVVIEDFKSIF